VEHRITRSNEPLEGAGLVAFTACGHWWVYPVRFTREQMYDLYDLARFNLGIICSFGVVAIGEQRQARLSSATGPPAVPGPAGR
jgi:hypothetical protein